MPRIKTRSAAQLANDKKLGEAAQQRAAARKAAEVRSVPPVVIRKSIEAAAEQVGQDGVREFDQNNELPHVATASAREIADEMMNASRNSGGHRGKKWMDDMAFANEMVTVIVHETTDKLAHPFPEVSVNGRVQRFVRGHEQQVRRCFVEKLARLKHTTFDSVKAKDVDGEDVYRYPSHTGLLYPFDLVNPTEKDRQWLKRILAEA